jgi:hypothetical protein
VGQDFILPADLPSAEGASNPAGGIESHPASLAPPTSHLRHWPFMRLRPLWLFLVPISLASQQGTPPVSNETLVYNIEWRLFNAGKANVQWLHEQRSGYQLNLHLESTGFVSKLFKVEDDYSANLSSSLCTESLQITTHEGNRDRETKVAFESGAKHANYLERDRAKNAVVAQHEIEIPSCVHDVVGGLFFLRTLNLEPGQSAMVPVSDGKKSVMAKVEAQAKEDVKTPEGVFHTVRYEAYLFDNVLYRRSAHLNVWLTDDRRRLPVQIRVRMTFTIGTITLRLEKHE